MSPGSGKRELALVALPLVEGAGSTAGEDGPGPSAEQTDPNADIRVARSESIHPKADAKNERMGVAQASNHHKAPTAARIPSAKATIEAADQERERSSGVVGR